MGNPERVVPLRTGNHGPDHMEPRPEDGGPWLSLHAIKQTLGIPPSSLRRYLDRHGRYIPSMKSAKRIMVARSALPVLERIRKLYDAGRTVAAVEEELEAAAFLAVREELAGVAFEGGRSRPSLHLSSPPSQNGGTPLSDGAGLPNPLPAEPAGPPLTEMQRQVAVLDRKLSDMRAAIENRDLMIRQILSAVVRVIEAQDNERRFSDSEKQIADEERDRQTAHRHQQLMLSLQEILNFTRRRRWLW